MALTTAFAKNGNKKAVPQTTQDGSVSYDQGFGNLYALPPEEGGLFIDRAQFNQIMYDTTSAVITNQNSINTLNSKVTANQNSINTLNSKVANIESSVSTGVVSLTGNQTIQGVKTFSSPPVSATNPTANNQVANKAYVDTVANAKANANATVNLTGDQSIAGNKTFTSNITAPNITNLQNQMGGLISSDSYPLLTKSSPSLDITVGAGGTFSNITDGLMFLKQNISKYPNTIGKITLLSNFNDDLYLKGYPFNILIDCNGYQLGNHLFLESSSITFNSLKLQGQLNAVISTVHIVNGADIGGNSSLSEFFGSSIVANGNSFIAIGGSVILRPPETEAGIYSKASRVYLVNPSDWTQSQGQYFGYVVAGGIICADNEVNLKNVTTTKTNVAVNTLTPYGIIFGNIWE